MELIHRMSWKRLKKFLCTGKNKDQKINSPDLISVLPEAGNPVPEKMALPIRMVRAAVSNLPRPARKTFSFRSCCSDICFFIRTSDFYFYLRWGLRKIMLWLAISLLIVLGLEMLFWVWIWQMSPEQFQKFTACLDAGVVPSLKERFIYHFACFWGNLGG